MSTEKFEYLGVNHVALVCKDMKETVDFYTNVLEMPLVKTIEMGPRGQHFFFDAGNGAMIAFFWYPDAPEAAPGIASQDQRPGSKFTSAHASMNHLAISIPLQMFDAYVARLKQKGIRVHVINHADNDKGYEVGLTAATWVRSMYFQDPSGIALELAAYTRAFRADDVSHAPATYADRDRFLAEAKSANGH